MQNVKRRSCCGLWQRRGDGPAGPLHSVRASAAGAARCPPTRSATSARRAPVRTRRCAYLPWPNYTRDTVEIWPRPGPHQSHPSRRQEPSLRNAPSRRRSAPGPRANLGLSDRSWRHTSFPLLAPRGKRLPARSCATQGMAPVHHVHQGHSSGVPEELVHREPVGAQPALPGSTGNMG